MAELQASYSNIIDRIKKVRSKESLNLLANGLFKSLSIVLALALLASIIENLGNTDTLFRTVLAGIIFISFVISFGFFVFPPMMRFFVDRYKPGIESVALRIGDSYPEIKDRLCNAIQLVADKSFSGYSSELVESAFSEVSNSARNMEFDVIIDKKQNRQWLLIFASILIIFSGSFMAAPGLADAFGRIANFTQSYVPPADFSLKVSPERLDILRGEDVLITINAEGNAPEQIELLIKEGQQEDFDKYKIRSDSSGQYTFELKNLKNSVTFYARSEWYNSYVTSNTGKVNISDRPIVRTLNGRIHYPAYTGQVPTDFDENNADITALKGSAVSIQILANKDLKEATLINIIQPEITIIDSVEVLPDTVINDLDVAGRAASGKFKITGTGEYWIELVDKYGETNSSPIRYGIVALLDAFPSIALLTPTYDVSVSEDAELTIAASFSDDYGFTSLKLKYRLAESRYAEPEENYKSMEIPIYKNEVSQDIIFKWNLNDLNISPEDRYEYYLEIFDNDIVSGPKSSSTMKLSVRLPSLDEVLNETDHAQDDIQKELEKVLKDAKKLTKDMDEMQNELRKNYKKKELNWKEKKQFEDILKKQAEIRKKMEDVSQKVDDMAKKLQDKNALSPETLQKFMELQQLMQQVKSPELEQMRKKMENAMKQVSPEQMRQAMEKVKFDEEKFKKSIERTLKLLKRLQVEQKTDAVKKRAEELAEKMEDLEKKTENANPNDKESKDNLSKKQDMAKEDFQEMLQETDELEQLMNEAGDDMPKDMLQQAKEDLNPQETMENMEQSSSQCKNGNMQQAAQKQKKASKKLRDFAKQMQDMKDQMQQKNSKEAQRKMQKAISDVLELSDEQESLMNQTKSADYNSMRIPDLAEKQAELQMGMNMVANSLMELSEKSLAVTPQMGQEIGNSLRQMQNALNSLSERRTRNASSSQGESMSAMNRAVSQMQSMLSAMQNQGSGSCSNPGGQGQGKPGQGSFGDQLQKLAQQQMGLNQALQQLSQNQGSMSQEQQAQMRRLAGKQGENGKSLQELAQEQKSNPAGDKKALGDLNKLAEEMNEVMTDLQSGKLNDDLLQKQDRILSRLLDATRSINERDFEKKRESKEGRLKDLASPDELYPNTLEGNKKALKDMLKKIKQGYSKDYEVLIRKYLEKISEEQAN